MLNLLLLMVAMNGGLSSLIQEKFYAGQEEQVLEAFEKAKPAEQQLPSSMGCMVAESYLARENFKEGFARFDARLTVDNGRDGSKRGERLTNPWKGSDPANKNIVVITEGGFGDVMSAPFLPFVQALTRLGAHVTVALSGGHKRLRPLLEKHSQLPNWGIAFTEVPDKEKVSQGDYQAFLMSLPQYVSIDPATGNATLKGVTAEQEIPRYPTITIQEASKTFWTDALSRGDYKGKYVIALAHAASLLPPGQHDRGLDRSIPLSRLVPAICQKFGLNNVAIINLIAPFNPAVPESEYGKALAQLKESFGAKRKKVQGDQSLSEPARVAALEKLTKEEHDQENNLRMSIVPDDYMVALRDPRAVKAEYDKEAYVDLGAILSVLGDAHAPVTGAVGSVDTSVINQAGLIVAGKPKDAVRVAGFLSKIHDWRWGKCAESSDKKSPWYPELTLFLQKKQGNWQPVVEGFVQWLSNWQKSSKQ
jgi:hypothetical protein